MIFVIFVVVFRKLPSIFLRHGSRGSRWKFGLPFSVLGVKHRCVVTREPLPGPALVQDVGAATSPGGPAQAVCPDAQVQTGHPPRPGTRLSP